MLAIGFALAPIALQAADVQHVYDKTGRLIQTIAPDGMNAIYTYDAVGNLLATEQKAANALGLVEFAPDHGSPGTTVTLSGSGFDSVAANNTVTFNGVAATVTQASAHALVVTVPASATTGPIAVTNVHGTVASATPFTVGNPLVVDGFPVAVHLSANSRIDFNFSGNAGTGYTLGLTGIVMPLINSSIFVTVKQPNGLTLITCSISSDSSCVLPYLPVSGSYTATLATGASAATLSLLLNADASGMLIPNGNAIEFIMDRVGRAGSYTFNVTTGMQGRLQVSLNTALKSCTLKLYSPTGVSVSSTGITADPNAISAISLNNYPLVDGVYKARMIPHAGITAGRMMINLVQAVAEALTIDAAPKAVSLLLGQQGRYSVTGMAGQYLGLGLADLSTTSAGNFYITVYKPDGSSMGSVSASGTSAGYAIPRLPVSGEYTIVIDPGNLAADFQLLLSNDVTDTLASDGTPQRFTPTRAGQAARYTFSGTAGENANLAITGSTFVGSTYVYVYKPDGSQLTYHLLSYSSGAGISGVLKLTNLPSTGTYVVRVVPPNGKLGAISVALRPEKTGNLTAGGAAEPVTLQVSQNASFTFTGNAGERFGVGLGNLAITPSGSLSVTLYKPNNSSLGSFTASGTSAGYAIPVLPETGTYRILIATSATNAANFDLWFSADESGTLDNGTIQTFTPARIGQSASYTFEGTAGQNRVLSLTGSTFVGSAYAYVYKPDGSLLSSKSLYYSSGAGVSGTLALNNLPSTGTYVVRVVPPSGKLGSMTLGLN